MEKLTEKKRKWVINQFRAGRSATSIARIQKISRQMVYKLAAKYKKEGKVAYKAKNAGRPRYSLNKRFVKKIVDLRKTTDYGSQKLQFVLNRAGFKISQHIVQRILDDAKLTDPCPKRRGQRKYIRFQWPISNFMWHCDWSQYKRRWYITYIDDRSRKIMAAGEFSNANEENAIFLLHQAILTNEVSPYTLLSDKGPQFYANKRNEKGVKGVSQFEEELKELGIKFWTARRNHPQTNGKQERWFGSMKARFKKHPEETLQDFVKWYNEERIHHALGYKTPNEVYFENL
jgi:putative transposase